jgi:hypothetical protein
VVLANANKSAVLRVHGWLSTTYLALYNLPGALPPLPVLATLANCYFFAGEYNVCKLLKSWIAQGFEPMMGIKPRTTLLLALANTTTPLKRRNG